MEMEGGGGVRVPPNEVRLDWEWSRSSLGAVDAGVGLGRAPPGRLGTGGAAMG